MLQRNIYLLLIVKHNFYSKQILMGSSFLMAQSSAAVLEILFASPVFVTLPTFLRLLPPSSCRTLPLCSIFKWPYYLPVFAPQTFLSIHPEVILLSLNSQALSNSSGGKIYFLYMVPLSFNKCTAHAQGIHLCHDTCGGQNCWELVLSFCLGSEADSLLILPCCELLAG